MFMDHDHIDRGPAPLSQYDMETIAARAEWNRKYGGGA